MGRRHMVRDTMQGEGRGRGRGLGPLGVEARGKRKYVDRGQESWGASASCDG